MAKKTPLSRKEKFDKEAFKAKKAEYANKISSITSITRKVVDVFTATKNLGKWLATFSKKTPTEFDFQRLKRYEAMIINTKLNDLDDILSNNDLGIKSSGGNVDRLNEKFSIKLKTANLVLKNSLEKIKSRQSFLSESEKEILLTAYEVHVISYNLLKKNKMIFEGAFNYDDNLINRFLNNTKSKKDDTPEDIQDKNASALYIQAVYIMLVSRLAMTSTILNVFATNMKILATEGQGAELLKISYLRSTIMFSNIFYNDKTMENFFNKFGMFEGIRKNIEVNYALGLIGSLKRHSETLDLKYNAETEKLLRFFIKKKQNIRNISYSEIRPLMEYANIEDALDNGDGLLQEFFAAPIIANIGLVLVLGVMAIICTKFIIHVSYATLDYYQDVADDIDDLNKVLNAKNSPSKKGAAATIKKRLNNNLKSMGDKASKNIEEEGGRNTPQMMTMNNKEENMSKSDLDFGDEDISF